MVVAERLPGVQACANRRRQVRPLDRPQGQGHGAGDDLNDAAIDRADPNVWKDVADSWKSLAEAKQATVEHQAAEIERLRNELNARPTKVAEAVTTDDWAPVQKAIRRMARDDKALAARLSAFAEGLRDSEEPQSIASRILNGGGRK